MGFRSPGPQEISQTLLAVGDRLSGIILENRKMKARTEELEAEKKHRERQFQLREKELAIKQLQLEQRAEGEDGAQGPRLIDMVRVENVIDEFNDRFERRYVNENGGTDFVDLNSSELKRELNDIDRRLGTLREDAAAVGADQLKPGLRDLISELEQKRQAGRDLLQKLVKARSTDEGHQAQLSSIRSLGGFRSPAAATETELGTSPTPATPSAPTVPVDQAEDRPATPELDGQRVDTRDQLMLQVKEKSSDDDILRGTRALIEGMNPKQAKTTLETFVRDILASEGPARAREIANLFTTRLSR